MDKELEKEIDQILQECRQDNIVRINYNISNIRRKAIEEAKVLELIQPKKQYSYELTSKGLKAYELGGISQYLYDLKSKENRDELIKELTYKQLKGSIFQVKYWWIILIISGIIGFITGNIELIIRWIK